MLAARRPATASFSDATSADSIRRSSVTSRKTSTTPIISPAPLKMGAALSSMMNSRPSRARRAVWLARPITWRRRRTFSTGFCRLPRVLADDAEYGFQRMPFGVGELPASQILGDGVHEADRPMDIAGDHRIPDRLQRGLEPLLALEEGFALPCDLVNCPHVADGNGLHMMPGKQRQHHAHQKSGEQQRNQLAPLQRLRAAVLRLAHIRFARLQQTGCCTDAVHHLLAALVHMRVGDELRVLREHSARELEPAVVAILEIAQRGRLLRVRGQQPVQRRELDLNGSGRCLPGREHHLIARQLKAAQPGFLVDEEALQLLHLARYLIAVVQLLLGPCGGHDLPDEEARHEDEQQNRQSNQLTEGPVELGQLQRGPPGATESPEASITRSFSSNSSGPSPFSRVTSTRATASAGKLM